MGYNLSPSNIFLLTAIFQLSIFLFEIPMGLVGSKYGEKVSILLGFFLSALYYILLPSTSGMSEFILLQIVLGASTASLSGSVSTFLKHFASQHGYSYLHIRKQYRIVTLIIGIISVSAGGLLSNYGMDRVFYLQGCIYVLLMGYILSIPYNPEHEFIEQSYLGIIKKSIKTLAHKDILLPTIFIYSFLAIEAAVYVGFQTQYIGTLGLPKKYLGIALGIFVLISTLFTSWLPKKPWVLSQWFFISIALCFIISSFLNVFYPSILSLIVLYITQIIRPMDIPMEDKILKTINDNTGSTVLSLVGFYERIGFIIITILIQFFQYSIFGVLGLSSLFLGVLYLGLSKNIK